ncbi:hypothetical protein CNX70_06815 [Janthinobacterium svalbardensis]|uniref:Uncharacterized protein n=1 Tax=Janthinobacterium svalbardensis TaxID=368607 RepID=A0A290WSP8_9BURK|nr:hypothetical protein [Janthinobacterium svalbardensis]ATD59929.1 hypothetical protein CNX70_06815 [Janthinobacterium svalbardensis]
MQDAELNAVEVAIEKYHSGEMSVADAQCLLRDAWELEEVNGRKRALEVFSSSAEGTIGDRYRFRAECSRDAELFIQAIQCFIEPAGSISPHSYYADVGVKFSIVKKISPRDLLWIASFIVDGHVLVQTLEKEDRYTGKRDYYRRLDVHEPRYKPSRDVLKEVRKNVAHRIQNLKHLLADSRQFAQDLKVLTA